jgi:hypothetical protein
MLVRIGSCGKGKKKKVFHDVPRHFFTAHAFIVRLRSPLPPHSPHTLSNADRNSLAFSLAQDISTRSFALATTTLSTLLPPLLFDPPTRQKKQALFRSKLVNFSPNPPHFSHAEAHFVRPSRPFTHAHTRTPSLFDFAFTLQEKSIQNTD